MHKLVLGMLIDEGESAYQKWSSWVNVRNQKLLPAVVQTDSETNRRTRRNQRAFAVAEGKLCDPSTTRVIPERFCDEVHFIKRRDIKWNGIEKILRVLSLLLWHCCVAFVYSIRSLSKFRSGYNRPKCIKLFFGYKKYDSVTDILFETGHPSFDSVCHNAKCTFWTRWLSCSNSMVSMLRACMPC